MAVSGAEQQRMTNMDRGNLLMSEKSCCVGIRLFNGLFYTAAAPDWSHKHTERREVWAANGGVEGYTVIRRFPAKSSCYVKLR